MFVLLHMFHRRVSLMSTRLAEPRSRANALKALGLMGIAGSFHLVSGYGMKHDETTGNIRTATLRSWVLGTMVVRDCLCTIIVEAHRGCRWVQHLMYNSHSFIIIFRRKALQRSHRVPVRWWLWNTCDRSVCCWAGMFLQSHSNEHSQDSHQQSSTPAKTCKDLRTTYVHNLSQYIQYVLRLHYIISY